ncbi:Lmbe-related protein [Paenibacillus pasadenensis]|uniref:Lmbe-related protein n=1 Tax=Paenibacillus pasadenensis TaxID=217090 RepID=A0A2N5N5T2_9BACL|nr:MULTISPECIES: bacillithiol biosynthesis deacetylase BshB1 [Paenibacillus]PLT45682.1 Lmbe-related protein [Paenibacillus pasadenensis]QGG56127.1 bacillithiol biosynthesis deacetylase BshB1 [Paenibacillus sp. B01]
MDAQQSQVDLLVFGAHADDAEIGMGGTIALHARQGWRVGVCDLTRSEMSSNGDPVLRAEEAAEASRILGLAYRGCLGLPDRGLTGDAEQIAAVVREIRLRRPRVVFAPYWQDRHPDHNACSAIVEEAVFNAKLRRCMPELPPVQVERLVYYYINDQRDIALTVDVTAEIGTKLDALAAYRSQFEAAGGDRVETPLTQGYVQRVEYRDYLTGQAAGCRYAEGFALKRPHPVSSFLEA